MPKHFSTIRKHETSKDINVDDVVDVDALPDTVHAEVASENGREEEYDDLSDPTPDIHALFAYYNQKHFNSKLTNVYVEFSKRMTLCAGTCTFRGIGGCRIALSEPLLKLRPASDLRSTLLHEMIHALLFNEGVSRDGPDGHGPRFMEIATRINACEPSEIQITPYHTFTSEVEHYRTHHWRCVLCGMLIRRAMNRPPGPYDIFWPRHVAACGGTFEKCREPPKKRKPIAVPKRGAVAAKAGGVHRQFTSTIARKGVMKTFRIDEMLSSRTARQDLSVPCPVCNVRIPRPRLNEHLDQCLSKEDFIADDEIVEVPVPPSAPALAPAPTHTAPIPALPQPHTAIAKGKKHDQIVSSSIPATTSSTPANELKNSSKCAISSDKMNAALNTMHFQDSFSQRPNPAATSKIEEEDDEIQIVSPVWKKALVKPETFIRLVIDPRAPVNDSIIQALQKEENQSTNSLPVVTSKNIPFSELLRPFLKGESAADRLKTAKMQIKPWKFPDSDDDFSFAALSRRLGVSRSEAFNLLIDKCDRQPDGSYIVPDDFMRLLSTSPQPMVNKSRLAEDKGALANNAPACSETESRVKSANGWGDESTRLAPPESRLRKRRKPNVNPPHEYDGSEMLGAINGVRQKEMGNYPICDKPVPRPQLHTHLNEYLADRRNPNVKPAHDSDRSVMSRTVNKVQGHEEIGNCPICDKAVPRSRLETHVNECLNDFGIKNEFCDKDAQNRQVTELTSASGQSFVRTDAPRCPICDSVVPRSQLQTHVDMCLTSTGLDDAF